MAKAASDNMGNQQMFSADVVAAVLMASGTVSLSMKQYEMMSALDGNRTASSFQHAFRAVLARAKDLKARVDAGEAFTPVAPANKRTNTPSSATLKKRKTDGDEAEGTPSKKAATAKRTKKTPEVKKEVKEEVASYDFGVEIPQDIEDQFA